MVVHTKYHRIYILLLLKTSNWGDTSEKKNTYMIIKEESKSSIEKIWVERGFFELIDSIANLLQRRLLVCPIFLGLICEVLYAEKFSAAQWVEHLTAPGCSPWLGFKPWCKETCRFFCLVLVIIIFFSVFSCWCTYYLSSNLLLAFAQDVKLR